MDLDTIYLGSSTNSREVLEAGTHQAKCFAVAYLGWKEIVWEGEMKKQNKLAIGFVTEDKTRLWKEFTLTNSPQGKFFPMLEAWLQQPFSDTDKEALKLSSLIGKPAKLVTTVKTSQKGSKYPIIASIFSSQVDIKVEIEEFKFNINDKELTNVEKVPFYLLPNEQVKNVALARSGKELVVDITGLEDTEEIDLSTIPF